MKRQAQYHGEVGVNGKAYQKGQFIAEQAEYQFAGSGKKASSRKVEIAPYQWEMGEEGQRSIYSILSTGLVKISESSFKARDWKTDRASINWAAVDQQFQDRSNFIQLCDRFDAGDRWL